MQKEQHGSWQTKIKIEQPKKLTQWGSLVSSQEVSWISLDLNDTGREGCPTDGRPVQVIQKPVER